MNLSSYRVAATSDIRGSGHQVHAERTARTRLLCTRLLHRGDTATTGRDRRNGNHAAGRDACLPDRRTEGGGGRNRRHGDTEALRDLLARLTGEADVRRLLVIGGDVEPVGPFPDALAVIQRGRLREAGIEEIGIAAYPEGHPRISLARLAASLDEKIASAAAQGLRVHIVTQFSFSAEHILSWLRKTRAGGISHPVRIGLAGPTSLPQLIRFAKRCGVAASLRGLTSGTASALIGNVGPDRIIEALAAAGPLGAVHPHYFSFGGVVATARYARRIADMECAAVQAAAHS
jgi:methylenetetrahydrofolate reductase (NADPH)